MISQPAAWSPSGYRIGYILKMFPRLSETFILNELLELERQGARLSVFSLMCPNDGRFHGRLSELELSAEYFASERAETGWRAVRALPDHLAVPFARWQEAADFLRRHRIPKDLELLLRAVLIAARVRQLGIQHLHAHFATVATRMAALVSMFTGVPFSFTAHAKDIFRETVDRGLFAELAERASFVITVSDFNKRYILERTDGMPRERLHRLYNGIDLGFFEPARGRHASGTPHFVSVGRLVPKKGFDHLLRALRHCADRGLEFRATIVGDGEEAGRLHALRDQLGLSNRVRFAGALAQEEVRRLVAEATLVALACVPDADGNMDALPTVLLEALALDRPVVSTRLAGIPEIVGDGVGSLVEPGDDLGLAREISSLMDRIRSGGHDVGACRARAERLFDLRRNVGELHRLFVESASQGAAA